MQKSTGLAHLFFQPDLDRQVKIYHDQGIDFIIGEQGVTENAGYFLLGDIMAAKEGGNTGLQRFQGWAVFAGTV